MKVLARKAASPIRQQVPEPKPIASTHTFPAPIRGLVLDENIAMPGPAGAQVLDNFVCTTTGIRARGGSQRYATLPGPVMALLVYRAPAGKMFAATATAIYDVSSAPNPMNATAVVTGQTGGDYSSAMFGTAGGTFLYVVNGADKAQLYNGLNWTAIDAASTPAITGADTATFSHVWSYANRLFFVQEGTMVAHYLPIDAIGGAAAALSLSGIFKMGGSLLCGATWSMDAGDGLDDKCVFISTEGEVAVYEGTNPGDAANWRLAGVYQISRPLGRNAVMRAGGDLLIATQSGLVPLSQAISKDPAALSMAAVSARIEPLWTSCAAVYDNPWTIAKWPEKSIMLVAMSGTGRDDVTLCCNLQTGGWSRWTNIGARVIEYFGGYVYAGGNDGTVKRLETGGSDMGRIYTAVYIGAHEGMGAANVQKTALQARALFRTSHGINPQIRAHTDYILEPAPPPSTSVYSAVGVWDDSKWDETVWDGASAAVALTSFWRSLGRTGYSIAPELQLSFAGIAPPNVELVSMDVTFTAGALVA